MHAQSSEMFPRRPRRDQTHTPFYTAPHPSSNRLHKFCLGFNRVDAGFLWCALIRLLSSADFD